MRSIFACALMLAALAGTASAFHDGGVASCQGCHVMHQSDDGLYVPASGDLLRGDSASDVCLGCHAGANGSVFGLDPLLPATEYGAGNFIFLLEDNINDRQQGSMRPIPGHAAGHSIVAPGAGLFADARFTIAPGGTFPAGSLGCTSCHDPHGSGSYRMLHRSGSVQGGLYTFFDGPPDADGVALDGAAEGPTNHTAYRDGWSAWCGNCHGADYHAGGQGRFEHPVDVALGVEVSGRYNAYAGDLDPSGGDLATAYLLQVPFEDPSATVSSTSGPTAASRITCLSCHRAHATSAPAAGRWDWTVDELGDDGAVSGSWPIPNPYGDPTQRSLCVKCHDVDHDNGKSCLNCHAPGQGGGGGYVPGG